MAVVSCKHRSTRAAYLVVIVIVRRLKGLAGDLGPSPSSRDVYARATREPLQVFFVSHSSVPQTVWETNVSFAFCGRVANCVGFVDSKVGCEFRACCNVVVDPCWAGGYFGKRSSLFSGLLYRVQCRVTTQNHDTTETACVGSARRKRPRLPHGFSHDHAATNYAQL